MFPVSRTSFLTASSFNSICIHRQSAPMCKWHVKHIITYIMTMYPSLYSIRRRARGISSWNDFHCESELPALDVEGSLARRATTTNAMIKVMLNAFEITVEFILSSRLDRVERVVGGCELCWRTFMRGFKVCTKSINSNRLIRVADWLKLKRIYIQIKRFGKIKYFWRLWQWRSANPIKNLKLSIVRANIMKYSFLSSDDGN